MATAWTARDLQLADDALPGPDLDCAFFNTQLDALQRDRIKQFGTGTSDDESRVFCVDEERIDRVWETPGQAAVRSILVTFESTSSSSRPRRRKTNMKFTSARTRAWTHSDDGVVGKESTVVTTVHSVPHGTVVIGKSVSVPELLKGSAKKASIRRRSFVSENAFLKLAPKVLKRSLAVPDVFFSYASENNETFAFILEDLRVRFPLQHSGFSVKHAQAALAWLARFHATFWEDRIPFGETWEEGTFWNLAKRPITTDIESSNLDNHVKKIRENWEASVVELSLPSELHGLCEKLLAKAEWLDDQLSSSESQQWESKRQKVEESERAREHNVEREQRRTYAKHRTMLHGDFKAENVLFAKSDDTCAAVDFQWCGGGFGARDVMYLLCSASCDKIRRQHAEPLLKFYYQRLEEEVRAVGVEDGNGPEWQWDYSWEEFVRHYQLSLCDFVRFCVSDGVLIKDECNDDTWLVEQAFQCAQILRL